ncbi:MAG: helix-turn-helix transcriptional regulator [Selenomonadaceae bacterium]|nr:helix-turn-helix transcriptional regulator [Selenomonadaceae bacterium]
MDRRINSSQTCRNEKTGLTQGAITSYEIARREPSIKGLVKLSETLNVSVDWLCGRTEKMKLK